VVRSHLDKAIVEAGFKIRSALATLYYPVDASSTLDPRDDPKLREQIAAFQRTLGNTPDGTLTFGEERELVRLQSMAHITPLKIIGSQSVLVGEDFAKATGSWVIQQDTIDARLNFSEIKCYRELGFCVEAQAKYFAPGEAWTSGEVQFSPYVHMEIYIVTSWSGQIVEAQLQGPPSNCRISTLTLNQATKVAALVTRDGEEACDFDGKQLLPRLGAPRVSTLEDPSAIRKKFYEDIADKVERHHGPLAPGAYIRPVIY
jgi:peptidoglycan hydrolase-like protein with peptidoglycan-binding domain